MPNYLVNDDTHEVHDKASTKGCLPDSANQVGLGTHVDCKGAVKKAKDLGYDKANGCFYCANPCHTD